jgi:flagellar protein FlaF
VTALHDNRRLWTAFAADLATQGNGFPPELRARLFYLAEFTCRHTDQVLSGAATADVLVEINTAVMRGLRGPRAGGVA